MTMNAAGQVRPEGVKRTPAVQRANELEHLGEVCNHLVEERDALRAEVERLRSALQALATVYGPLSSSMKIGSERRMLWDAAFKALERRP